MPGLDRFPRRVFAAAVLLASSAPLAIAAPGDPLGPPQRVNTTRTGDQQNPSIARGADGASVVCWESDDGSLTGVFAQRFDAGGARAGGEFRVNTHTSDRQGSCDVAMDAQGRFAVVWRGSSQDGSGSGIYGQRYGADGRRLGGEFQVNVHTKDAQAEPAIAMDAAGEFVVAWSERALVVDAGSADRRTICARAFKADGTPRKGDQVNVYTEFGPRVLTPGVGIAQDGSFVVVYFRDGSPNSIEARRFLASGLGSGPVFPVAKAPAGVRYDLPTVAMNAAGDFAVVWEATFADGSRAGLYGRRYAHRGVIPPLPKVTIPTVPELPPLPTDGSLPTLPPLPALPVIAPTDVLGALGPAFRIDADDHALGRASLVMNDDRSLVVVGDADGDGLFARRFDGDGASLGALQRIDTANGVPLWGRVAADAQGDHAVAWQSYSANGSRRDISLRTFSGR